MHESIKMNLVNELDATRTLLKRDRKRGIAALDEIYRRGTVPDPPLNGRYWGELLTSSLNPVLDSLLGGITQIWFPWQGKTFDAATQTGDNIFTNDGLIWGRLLWPFHNGYIPDGRGRSRTFQFRFYPGPSLIDPEIQVLRMDFDRDINPKFLVRDLVDQLVQIGDDYYLGKAVLRRPGGGWFCAAYFTLSSGLKSA
jgi:hypothetical protein